MQVINTGMKVIARAEADNVGCNFRLMQEVCKQIIIVIVAFILCIQKRKFSCNRNHFPFTTLADGDRVGRKIVALNGLPVFQP